MRPKDFPIYGVEEGALDDLTSFEAVHDIIMDSYNQPFLTIIVYKRCTIVQINELLSFLKEDPLWWGNPAIIYI
jgi:hypothetical protein